MQRDIGPYSERAFLAKSELLSLKFYSIRNVNTGHNFYLESRYLSILIIISYFLVLALTSSFLLNFFREKWCAECFIEFVWIATWDHVMLNARHITSEMICHRMIWLKTRARSDLEIWINRFQLTNWYKIGRMLTLGWDYHLHNIVIQEIS